MTNNKIPRQLFITGTDTGIGKTVVSAILVSGLNGKYWKPIQSGLEETTDTQWIQEVTTLPENHFFPETYRLQRPLSPHASAVAEGTRINLDIFQLPSTEDYLIVEGAGGIMVPLNETHLMLDLMKKLDIPVLLVARSELGTINHTLLSLEQMRISGLEVFGVIMNGPRNPVNRESIEHFGNVTVRAEIEYLPEINRRIRLNGAERSTYQQLLKFLEEFHRVQGVDPHAVGNTADFKQLIKHHGNSKVPLPEKFSGGWRQDLLNQFFQPKH